MPSAQDIERAAEFISQAKVLVAFTGSGVSQESGIPTFRDPGGLWDRYDPDEVSTGGGLLALVARRPEMVKNLLLETAATFEKAAPNPGHMALAELERIGILRSVVTQNIDNLHSEAGNTKVIEVHGNLYRFRCLSCQARRKLMKGEVLDLGRRVAEALGRLGFQEILEFLPRCDSCGSPMRPDVVMFGEAVQDLHQAFNEAGSCDVLLILGTSGVVYPAASIPSMARQVRARVIDINPGESAFSSLLDVHIRRKSGEGLPLVMDMVKRMIS